MASGVTTGSTCTLRSRRYHHWQSFALSVLLARVARPCALEVASLELGGRAASYLLCVGRWRQIKDGRRRNSQELCRRKGNVPAGYDDYVRNKGKGNDVGKNIKGNALWESRAHVGRWRRQSLAMT